MNTYKCIAKEMFHSVGQAVGIHVLLLVLEHAQWKSKHKYEEADLIRFSEDGIYLEGLDDLDRKLAEQVAKEFIMSIVATLSRLVGKQLANQLTEQIKESL